MKNLNKEDTKLLKQILINEKERAEDNVYIESKKENHKTAKEIEKYIKEIEKLYKKL